MSALLVQQGWIVKNATLLSEEEKENLLEQTHNAIQLSLVYEVLREVVVFVNSFMFMKHCWILGKFVVDNSEDLQNPQLQFSASHRYNLVAL